MAGFTDQVADGSLRAAPAVTMSAASFLGLGLEQWMYVATILYTILQGSYLVYRWRRSHRKYRRLKRERQQRREYEYQTNNRE